MELNIEQLRAIKIIDKNVAVNAGAGTGKTEVLTRRYLEILKNAKLDKGEEISNIVAITFTVKAANEMKERIRKILSEEDDLKTYLEDINEAQISTIHSFCVKLIRDNSLYLDIDPNFEVFEEIDRYKVLKSTIEDIIFSDEQYFSFISDLLNLLNINEIEEIIEEIINLLNIIKTSTFSIKTIKDITIANMGLLNNISSIAKIKKELLDIKSEGKLPKNTNLYKFISNDFNIDNIAKEEIFKKLLGIINVKNIDKLKYLINLELEFREYGLLHMYSDLFNLLEKIDYEFTKIKRKLGKFDFNDLEHFALNLLEIRTVKENIQDNIKYLMVDEYQDSNDVQKEIFYKICSKNSKLDRSNLFVVGDPKQSIYGFRGANIHVFDNTRNDIFQEGEVITFTKNYRTNDLILNGIDNIYSNLMGDRYSSLKPSRVSDNKILYLNNDNKRDKEFESNHISNFIAKEINNDRLKQFGDFTLLFRAKSDQVLFEKNFTNRKIPFYTFDSPGFFKSEEIVLIREILKLIKNTKNNYSIYYILKSKIYNLKDEDLLLWNTNQNLSIEAGMEDLQNKIIKLCQFSKDSIFDLLSIIYEIFHILEIYNYSELNIQKQGNLYKLLEIAYDFDKNKTSFDEFFYFLMDNLNEENMKQVEDENSNVVKLMTIHGSKGLGFNDVIVPCINKTSYIDRNYFKFNKEFGISINFELANARYLVEKRRLLFEDEIENDNIYYVAMTRAKNNLILGLSGIKNGYKKRLIDEIDKLTSMNLIEKLENIEFEENLSFQYNKKEPVCEFDYIKDINNNQNKITMNISNILNYYYESKENSSSIRTNSKFGLPYNNMGKIVHRYAELYNGEDLDIKEILKEFEVDILHEPKFSKYINIIKNFYNSNIELYYNEIPFSYKINNLYFSGIIDRIELYGNILSIIDYKFSYLDKDSLRDKYWMQLVFYGLVCEKLYPDKEIELIIKNIRQNYKLKVDFDDKIKREFFCKLDNFIKNNSL